MKPRIIITLGDPAGIGPEIVADALANPKVLEWCEPVVIGDPVAFARHHRRFPKVEMLPVPGLPKNFPLGAASRETGLSAIESLRLAVGLIQRRQADALVTAPVSKESLRLAEAGSPHIGRPGPPGVWRAGAPGHTEWLAQQTGASSVAMLMVAARLRAVLLTRHVPLAQVSKRLTAKTIEAAAALSQAFLKTTLKIQRPRMAACGLNPHAGDGGLLGKEEQTVIQPALEKLRKKGLAVAGPLPADSVFRDMARGDYDLALAAYHDQGMIPLKLHAPERLVNITLGLPFIRTSPGHGTAYDIAGKDRASAKPMIEAIRLAA